MSLSKIIKQYKGRETYFGQKTIKTIEWLLKSEKDIKSLKLTDVVKEIKLKHCVRCHKDYCEDDPNDICKIEHGDEEENTTSEGDWDSPMYKYCKFEWNACSCTFDNLSFLINS